MHKVAAQLVKVVGAFAVIVQGSRCHFSVNRQV